MVYLCGQNLDSLLVAGQVVQGGECLAQDHKILSTDGAVRHLSTLVLIYQDTTKTTDVSTAGDEEVVAAILPTTGMAVGDTAKVGSADVIVVVVAAADTAVVVAVGDIVVSLHLGVKIWTPNWTSTWRVLVACWTEI